MTGLPRWRATAAGYRGPDRRGIVGQAEGLESRWTPVWMAAAVLAVPVLGAAVLTVAAPAQAGTVATGAADAAFVGLMASAILLFLRWRLVGEAGCASFAVAAGLAGLLIVPTAARFGGPAAGYAAALRAWAVVLALGAALHGLHSPEVRAGLRPVALAAAAVGAALALAVPLALLPIQGRLDGLTVADLAEALAGATGAGVLMLHAVRRRRLLPAGVAGMLLGTAGAGAALACPPADLAGGWSALPALFLLAGAVELLAVAAGDLRSAIGVVVQDVRGRRRWEAAEDTLTSVQERYRGQRHDIRSILSAIDGTLMVVATQRDRLPAERTDRLVSAMREEIQLLQSLLVGDGAEPRPYDLSGFLAGIAAVRAAGPQRLRQRLQPGLRVRGHPERMAAVVSNLLANAAVHAPGASVTLAVRRLPGLGGLAEITVADDGPGLDGAGLERAFARGWRGTSRAPGSGLGLYQCRLLAEAEGGSITLRHTDPLAPPGHRGLTARVRIPLDPAHLPAAPPPAGGLADQAGRSPAG